VIGSDGHGRFHATLQTCKQADERLAARRQVPPLSIVLRRGWRTCGVSAACRRTSISAADSRRRACSRARRTEAHLARWGYPYVLDRFRFHVTLTGRSRRSMPAGSPLCSPLRSASRSASTRSRCSRKRSPAHPSSSSNASRCARRSHISPKRICPRAAKPPVGSRRFLPSNASDCFCYVSSSPSWPDEIRYRCPRQVTDDPKKPDMKHKKVMISASGSSQ